MIKDIIVYGAGGFGRETALMLSQMNGHEYLWRFIGFCDDNVPKGQVVNGFPVLGGVEEINSYSEVSVVIAVADPHARKNIRSRIINPKVSFPSLVHPSVLLGDVQRNALGEGSIIAAGNILTTNISIGGFVIINLSCTVGHDVVVADYVSIMPGCSISGFVSIGDAAQLGTGARILPGLKVGNNSRVGAGAVVTHDVLANVTVVGVPAKPV